MSKMSDPYQHKDATSPTLRKSSLKKQSKGSLQSSNNEAKQLKDNSSPNISPTPFKKLGLDSELKTRTEMTILDNPDTVGNLVSRYGSEHQQEKISDTTMAEASKNIQLSENASPYTNL